MLLLLYLLHWITAPVDLEQALRQKQVQVSVLANSNSAHYQNPVSLSLRNNGSSSLEVRIPAGTVFLPEDSSYQGYISNRDLIVKLGSGERKTLPVSAMCIHAGRKAPLSEIPYHYQGKADGSLLRVAELIQELQLQETVQGQQAVWTVSDNEPLESVTSFSESSRALLVQRLAAITGRPVPPPPAPDDYERNLQLRPRQSRVGGFYEFTLARTQAIHIAMFSEDNVVLRELYNNPAESPGPHRIEFEFDASVYTGNLYYFRLLADGEIKLETEMSSN